MIVLLLGHSDVDGATHMDTGSPWVVISMIAFALFLLAFAWSLLRPAGRVGRTREDSAMECFGRREIGADDLRRTSGDIDPPRR